MRRSLTICLLLAAVAAPAWGLWRVARVDNDGDVGWGADMTLDGQGRAWLAYSGQHPDSSNLRVATVDGDSQVISYLPHLYQQPSFLRVAADALGGITVAHGQNGIRLYVTYRTAWFDWQTQLVDDHFDGYPALAFDENARPHLAYAAHGQLRYATYDRQANQWTATVVDAGQNGFEDTELALLPDGRIVIAVTAYDGQLRTVNLYLSHDSGWTHTRMDVPAYSVGLAIDAQGAPLVVYGDSSQLLFARTYLPGFGWLAPALVDDGSGGVPCNKIDCFSLALSPAGVPSVAYLRNEQLVLATQTPAGWVQTGPVAYVGPVNAYQRLKLTFDAAGDPLVSFYNRSVSACGSSLCLAGPALVSPDRADLDCNGMVNLHDWAWFDADWQMGGVLGVADLNGDGTADLTDVAEFAAGWLWQRQYPQP